MNKYIVFEDGQVILFSNQIGQCVALTECLKLKHAVSAGLWTLREGEVHIAETPISFTVKPRQEDAARIQQFIIN